MSQPLRKWHVYIAGKSFYEDQSCVVEFLLRFENKQQSKPYNDSAQAQEIIIYWYFVLYSVPYMLCGVTGIREIFKYSEA